MPYPALPFIEALQLASAAFAEAAGASGGRQPAKKDAPYVFQVLVSGFAQLEAAAKRYVAAAGSRVVIGDPRFRAAALACAERLEAVAPMVDPNAYRAADALRRWIETENPTEALTVAMACDAMGRISKMKSTKVN